MRRAPGIFGIRLCEGTMDEVVAALRQPPRGGGALALYTLNVAHVTALRRNAAFRQAYRSAWLATADGMPVYLYARLSGAKVHKVAGSDLVMSLLDARRDGMRAFFVASTPETAHGIRARLLAKGFAETALAFDIPPFGFERDADYSRALAARIAAHGTTHLFMGVGAPKSEIWVAAQAQALGDCFALCVGAGLDFLAGTKRRAPPLLQRAGLEWSWRLVSEPRRLARRYLLDGFAFLYIVALGKLDLERDERPTI